MACDILKGRTLSCKDQRGGIKLIDFAPFANYNFTVASQEIAALPVSLTEVFRYEVKAAANTLVETATTNLDNRTTEIQQVLALTLQKLSKESETELLSLMYGRVVAFVHDYNGNVIVLGIESGLESTSSVKQTGGAGGDLSGYTISMSAMSSKFSPFLSSTAKTALEALVSTDVVNP